MIKKLSLIIIILLATFLRFNQITELPALNADEAAIGYNAYSLLQTGRDEHGNSWPIHFQSFNDYKPGLYFYLSIPFVHFLGLNELAVRLPGVIAGILNVVVVFFLVKKLFPKNDWFAYLTSLFLSLSPWHLHFSRGAWEVNVATLFITLGLLFFVDGLKNKKLWFVSALFFVLSLYTYHAARIIVPLFAFGIFVLYFQEITKNLKKVFFIATFSLVLLLPLANDILNSQAAARVSGVGLFADSGPFSRTNEQRGEHDKNTFALSRVLHNKVVNYGLAFLSNYTEHFWGEFLFISGDDIQRNKVPEMGQLYLIEFIFVVFGIIAILRNTSNFGIILIWLVISPIAAALTFQSPHALRAQNMVIPLSIISAYGAISLLNWIKAGIKYKPLITIFYILISIFYIWDVGRYLHQYYNHMSQTYDYSSQYGVKELVLYVAETTEKYPQVVVTNRYDQPYILFLFYLKYPPEQFQKEHVLTDRDTFGFSTVDRFGKFIFTETKPWDTIGTTYRNALIAGTDEDIPDASNILKTIYFPSGRVAFQVVAN